MRGSEGEIEEERERLRRRESGGGVLISRSFSTQNSTGEAELRAS